MITDQSERMLASEYIREKALRELREEVERELSAALKDFVLARAMLSDAVMEEAVQMPAREVALQVSSRNIMSVDVPVIQIADVQQGGSLYPYSFASTSGDLDGAIATLVKLLPKLVRLAEIEKTCNMLADEIEKTRRRVNALEYVMIPQLEQTIRSITMKLDENERGNLTRLMKTKEILAKRNA